MRDFQGRKKSKRKAKVIVTSALIVILVILAAVGIYACSILSKMKITNLHKTKEELGVTSKSPNETKTETINILLFGLDRRSKDEASRSDSIMVATIDGKTKQVKLASLMRDMYLPIPGYSSDKINAAYQLGGPALAIKTVNTNFNLDITRYVTVDFFALEKVIDKLGGVYINVKNYELKDLNHDITDANVMDGGNVSQVEHTGFQLLNGRQAVAYARIRHSGNSDFERTQRQRYVLDQLFSKAKSSGWMKMPDIISAIIPCVETNINQGEILSLASEVATFPGRTVKQFRIPADSTFKNDKVIKSGVKMDVLIPDMDKNVSLLHNFIYGTDTANNSTANSNQ